MASLDSQLIAYAFSLLDRFLTLSDVKMIIQQLALGYQEC